MSASSPNKHILVTGGTGFIGIHTLVSLIESGYDVTVLDNLSNSCEECLARVPLITGCDPARIRFFKADLRDYAATERVFQQSPTFAACIHFAGLKAVGESVREPLLYYENNVGGTITLLQLMEKYRCPSIVFSSSATVYGERATNPIVESAQTGVGITNAYGRTKFMVEEILKDYMRARDLQQEEDKQKGRESGSLPFSVVLLRYFNPVGAHPSGLIGEDPNGIPNNLMPYIAQVVVGRREKLTVFGGDYPTPDGTGVRDYLHVMDLAEGHVAALRYVENRDKAGHNRLSVFNLGTGVGYSVLDLVHAMRKASGQPLLYEVGPRRPGDIAVCFSDASLAEKELKWKALRGLDEMCRDVWNWQSKNPNGYKTA